MKIGDKFLCQQTDDTYMLDKIENRWYTITWLTGRASGNQEAYLYEDVQNDILLTDLIKELL